MVVCGYFMLEGARPSSRGGSEFDALGFGQMQSSATGYLRCIPNYGRLPRGCVRGVACYRLRSGAESRFLRNDGRVLLARDKACRTETAFSLRQTAATMSETILWLVLRKLGMTA